MRTVLVLNQFALPRSEGGGTRHIDLFSRVPGWTPKIVAGNRNHYSQKRFATPDRRFRLVAVPRQDGGGASRLVGWLLYSAKALRIALTAPRMDAIYASSPHMFAPLVGWLASRARRVPFVLEIRDLWPESIVAAGKMRKGGLAHRVFQQLERLLVRRADAIVAVTAGWDDHFASLGVDPTLVFVVPNGTEPADFEIAADREALRAKHNITGNTAVFAGAHGDKDGLDHILDAAQKLENIRFLLVGAGPAKAAAISRATQLGLSNIQFREPVPKEDLPGLLKSCDIGIHSVTPLSVFERGMSPNKLFDYMAAGLPVASNAAGPLSAVVSDGECGRLGGPNDLAFCIQDIAVASPAQRARWGAFGKALIRDRFSRQAAASQLAHVLDSVVVGGNKE
ncbi:glycosyltransferase family 4 protein [Knoellia sp. 3-2P3]|uniref:glycosyltransferase family 4 protein n=1 Tax=unclassified Knoellia TaxID=2618719 RepID=UPI0023DC834D|nr:glycosyltransferase family 4 protein [Knoellia sp. 3-2P3]MDF2094123.1 glycosyltransferase family 4 protein [Knoellia sp. 3-2P3]